MTRFRLTGLWSLGVLCWHLGLSAPAVAGPDKPDVKETNRAEVQTRICGAGGTVVFGKELDHAEYLKIAGALATAIATETPAPVVAYFQEFAAESTRALATGLKQALILMALRNPGKVFRDGKWEVTGGFATYEHWKAIGIEVPDRVEIKGFNVTVRKRMEWAKVQLPNTHQPWVRLQIIKESP